MKSGYLLAASLSVAIAFSSSAAAATMEQIAGVYPVIFKPKINVPKLGTQGFKKVTGECAITALSEAEGDFACTMGPLNLSGLVHLDASGKKMQWELDAETIAMIQQAALAGINDWLDGASKKFGITIDKSTVQFAINGTPQYTPMAIAKKFKAPGTGTVSIKGHGSAQGTVGKNSTTIETDVTYAVMMKFKPRR